MSDLLHLPEPLLRFGHGQDLDDPRDGLALFGPLDEGKPYGIRYGVVGTPGGIALFKGWVAQVQHPVSVDPPQAARPPFPGFEAAFGVPWDPRPAHELSIAPAELSACVLLADRHQRVFRTVDLYAARILDAGFREEAPVDLWVVVVPDDVYKYCRPRSSVEAGKRLASTTGMTPAYARRLRLGPSLFPEDDAAAAPYHFDADFRHQLKARLLGAGTPTQVVRERTLRDTDGPRAVLQSAIAWHLATAAFYKAGGRPWKLASVRPGVCYLGLVFKQDEHAPGSANACCAAQMFLDSGDGMVFRGALGPWRNPETGRFHLSRDAARDLMATAVGSYRAAFGAPPSELFVHGKVRFDDEEWAGFAEAAGAETKLVGVRIGDERDFRLYRAGRMPTLRGLAYARDRRTGYLWTRGYVPRLRTYPGREVPRPLVVDLCRGDAPIETVLDDVLALTKLNYNACVYADGVPVTLRFADAVGEILTAGPDPGKAPLPFKFYI